MVLAAIRQSGHEARKHASETLQLQLEAESTAQLVREAHRLEEARREEERWLQQVANSDKDWEEL